ncbi:hypothetical protein ABPG72_004700 [Tetrahymena utriculariae]
MNQDKHPEITDEEQELITVEELSQKLELLYKDMEQIRRENLLFEAYLARNRKEIAKEDEVSEDKKGKGKKKDKNVDKKSLLLTNEEKFEIAQQEQDALKKQIDDGRIKSDQILETLRAILEETDMAITEIRKDAFDFQREILVGGENSRTGKIEAEKIIKFFEEKERQKDALIAKYSSKRTNLERQILKTNNQIQKKEEMGDDLKFIDFYQLQIENKKYVKEIDDKNKKLLALKISTNRISQTLKDEKQNLKQELDKGKEYASQMSERKKKISKIDGQIKSVKQITSKLEKQRKVYDKQKEIFEQDNQDDVPQIMKYVQLKSKEQELLYAIQNLERKIEIAELAYKTAKRTLQSSQQFQQK